MSRKLLASLYAAALLALPAGRVAAVTSATPSAGPASPIAQLTTVIASSTVNAGTDGAVSVGCPAGMVAISGGVDPANIGTMTVGASAPTFGGMSMFALADGSYDGPDGWRARVINNDSSAATIKVGVVCASMAGVRAVVGSNSAPAGSHSTESVVCPPGRVAVGGGIHPAGVVSLTVTSSSPLIGSSRTFSVTNGTYAAPNGWFGAVRNDDATPRTFKVGVICARESAVNLSTVVSSVAIGGSGGADARYVNCPAGQIAFGGGVDPADLDSMMITSTGPAVTGDRLQLLPDGTYGDPSGWYGAARNELATSKNLRVAAICTAPYRVLVPAVVKSFGPCEIEPNNTYPEANGPLNSGGSYCGYHHPAQITQPGDSDKDYFMFTKAAGGTVSITVTSLQATGQVTLYGQDGGTAIGFSGGPSPFVITCSGTANCTGGSGSTNAAGTYYIRVVTPAGYSPSTPYNLTVTFP